MTYSDLFTEWSFSDSLHFFRVSGAVFQQVWFENVSSGAYRPASGLRILVAPESKMLHQFLDSKNREILPREHSGVSLRVAQAMNEQFIPEIRKPLDPLEACEFCENTAAHRINDAHAMSGLYAYLGNDEKASEWLDMLDSLLLTRINDLMEWERNRMEYGSRLRECLKMNGTKDFLDATLSQELCRLSF